MPEPPEGEKLEEKAGESHNCPNPALTVRQRHGILFDKLDLRGLDSWTPELADAACQPLAKYYDMFSLDLAELGCTHSTEHIIKVTNDTPFKEQFRRIPPPMVEEVRNLLRGCWSLAPLDLAGVHGAMPWCWCGGGMEPCISVSISAT